MDEGRKVIGIVAAILTTSATVWMAFFTLALTITSVATMCILKNQLDVMSGQLGEMQAQRQPWMGLEHNSLNVTFTPDAMYHPLQVEYSVKNFGTGPAIGVQVLVQAIRADQTRVPQVFDKMSGNCPAREEEAHVIYPGKIQWMPVQMAWQGDTIQDTDWGQFFIDFTSPPSHIGEIWIFVCVSYWQGEKPHYSHYLFITKHIRKSDNSPLADIPIPGHPGWTYLPVTGVELRRANAQ